MAMYVVIQWFYANLVFFLEVIGQNNSIFYIRKSIYLSY